MFNSLLLQTLREKKKISSFSLHINILFTYLQPYDFKSVMHYDKYSSSVDPYYGWYPVMENKNDPWMELGNYIGMTPTDIAEVLAVYG